MHSALPLLHCRWSSSSASRTTPVSCASHHARARPPACLSLHSGGDSDATCAPSSSASSLQRCSPHAADDRYAIRVDNVRGVKVGHLPRVLVCHVSRAREGACGGSQRCPCPCGQQSCWRCRPSSSVCPFPAAVSAGRPRPAAPGGPGAPRRKQRGSDALLGSACAELALSWSALWPSPFLLFFHPCPSHACRYTRCRCSCTSLAYNRTASAWRAACAAPAYA